MSKKKVLDYDPKTGFGNFAEISLFFNHFCLPAVSGGLCNAPHVPPIPLGYVIPPPEGEWD